MTCKHKFERCSLDTFTSHWARACRQLSLRYGSVAIEKWMHRTANVAVWNLLQLRQTVTKLKAWVVVVRHWSISIFVATPCKSSTAIELELHTWALCITSRYPGVLIHRTMFSPLDRICLSIQYAPILTMRTEQLLMLTLLQIPWESFWARPSLTGMQGLEGVGSADLQLQPHNAARDLQGGGPCCELDSLDGQECAVAWSHLGSTREQELSNGRAAVIDSARSQVVDANEQASDEVQQLPTQQMQDREADMDQATVENPGPASPTPEESSASLSNSNDPAEILAAYRKRVKELVQRSQVCAAYQKAFSRSPSNWWLHGSPSQWWPCSHHLLKHVPYIKANNPSLSRRYCSSFKPSKKCACPASPGVKSRHPTARQHLKLLHLWLLFSSNPKGFYHSCSPWRSVQSIRFNAQSNLVWTGYQN